MSEYCYPERRRILTTSLGGGRKRKNIDGKGMLALRRRVNRAACDDHRSPLYQQCAYLSGGVRWRDMTSECQAHFSVSRRLFGISVSITSSTWRPVLIVAGWRGAARSDGGKVISRRAKHDIATHRVSFILGQEKMNRSSQRRRALGGSGTASKKRQGGRGRRAGWQRRWCFLLRNNGAIAAWLS